MAENRAFISRLAGGSLTRYISGLGYEIEYVDDHCESPIGTHADLYYCDLGPYVYEGDKTLPGSSYPSDAIYNAACTGRFFIHNTDVTHPDLLNAARDLSHRIIHVKQGYAKCSCCIVDENSIITSDAGIAKAAEGILDVCQISTGHISLKHYKYGFIGGASGKIENEIVFNGDLSSHPDYRIMKEFIESRGLSIRYFKGYPLTDIGSIITTTGGK